MGSLLLKYIMLILLNHYTFIFYCFATNPILASRPYYLCYANHRFSSNRRELDTVLLEAVCMELVSGDEPGTGEKVR